MIGIYAGTTGKRGFPVRLAMTYNGLTLNSPNDTLSGRGAVPDTYEVNTVVGSTSLDYISETNQQRDGLEVYTFRKVNRIVTIKGTIRAPSQEKLYDKIKALANAFDPAKIDHDNADGFLAFDFSSPTTDTANYASGLVPSRYYAKPLRIPDPVIDYASGTSAFFDVVLLMRDPRRYSQTQSSQSGAATVTNALADYPSPATVTITMSGAGNAAATVVNTNAIHGTQTLTLNLSGLSAGNVVVIDMERATITVNGTSTPSLYVSGSYWHVDPNTNNVISYANTGGQSSRVLTWRPAWSI